MNFFSRLFSLFSSYLRLVHRNKLPTAPTIFLPPLLPAPRCEHVFVLLGHWLHVSHAQFTSHLPWGRHDLLFFRSPVPDLIVGRGRGRGGPGGAGRVPTTYCLSPEGDFCCQATMLPILPSIQPGIHHCRHLIRLKFCRQTEGPLGSLTLEPLRLPICNRPLCTLNKQTQSHSRCTGPLQWQTVPLLYSNLREEVTAPRLSAGTFVYEKK